MSRRRRRVDPKQAISPLFHRLSSCVTRLHRSVLFLPESPLSPSFPLATVLSQFPPSQLASLHNGHLSVWFWVAVAITATIQRTPFIDFGWRSRQPLLQSTTEATHSGRCSRGADDKLVTVTNCYHLTTEREENCWPLFYKATYQLFSFVNMRKRRE